LLWFVNQNDHTHNKTCWGQEFKYRARNQTGRKLYQAIANASRSVRDSSGPFEFQIPRFEVFLKNLLYPLDRVLVPNDFETKLMSMQGINHPFTIFEILMESSATLEESHCSPATTACAPVPTRGRRLRSKQTAGTSSGTLDDNKAKRRK
jgi:hypothetical protein